MACLPAALGLLSRRAAPAGWTAMRLFAPAALATLVLLSPTPRAQHESLFPGGTLSVLNDVAVGDLNHDGLDDLVSFALSPASVSVRLGRPDGTWGPPKKYPAGNTGLAIGDVNGDGHPDIVSGAAQSSLRVVLGNGDGSFGPPISTPANYIAVPTALTLADFDGDGRADVAAASTFAFMACDCVRVALSAGDGTFGAPTQVPAGQKAQSVIADDFDGDGRTDVLALGFALNNEPQIALAAGDGRGLFGPVITTGTLPYYFAGLASARLDGDDLPDLALCTWNDALASALTLYRNRGDRTFEAVETLPLIDLPAPSATTPTPAWPVIADVDEDGVLDVVVSVRGFGLPSQSGLWFVRGLGDFAFAPPVFIDANFAGRPQLTDFDHDGHSDLLLLGPESSGPLALVRGLGDGSFLVPGLVDAGAPARDIAALDLNADRHPDLVTAVDEPGVAFRVNLGAGDGTFAAATDVGGAAPVQRFVAGDVNGDGRPDLVSLVAAPPGSLQVQLGAGDGAFGDAAPLDAGTAVDLALADLDGDGALDVVTAGADQRVGVLLNLGAGRFAPVAYFPTLGENAAVAVGDVDEDGVPDVCVAQPDAMAVAVLRGLGNGALAAPVPWPVGKNARGLHVADVDDDGHADLVTANYKINAGGMLKSPSLAVLHGDGRGAFATAVELPLAQVADRVRAADLDKDGLTDLVPGFLSTEPAAEGAITVLFGQPDHASFEARTFTAGGSPAATAIADFDANGFPDIALASSQDETTLIEINRSATWATLGYGLGASLGTPLLAGSGLPIADQLVSATVSSWPRGASGLLFVGFGAGFTPLSGGTLVPAQAVSLALVSGVPLTARWPKGLPTGTPLYLQAWFAGKAGGLPAGEVAATNALVTLSQ